MSSAPLIPARSPKAPRSRRWRPGAAPKPPSRDRRLVAPAERRAPAPSWRPCSGRATLVRSVWPPGAAWS